MKHKRYKLILLFIVSILMLVMPVVPHHHHNSGEVCMKNDLTPEQQCPTHHHSDDACCNSGCMARFSSSTPTVQTDCGQPHYILVATLFTDYLLEQLLRPQERQNKNNYAYRENLHGANVLRAFGLRAPPCA
ncbi:MAG: DUF6769 family protein [Bacteroides sp.]